jgi:hypothetical protein
MMAPARGPCHHRGIDNLRLHPIPQDGKWAVIGGDFIEPPRDNCVKIEINDPVAGFEQPRREQIELVPPAIQAARQRSNGNPAIDAVRIVGKANELAFKALFEITPHAIEQDVDVLRAPALIVAFVTQTMRSMTPHEKGRRVAPAAS